MADPLTLDIQGTPNPNAMKVTLNRVVATQGKTYRDAASADVEWVKQILAIAGVTQVFILNNFVSVNKRSDAKWETIGSQVEGILRRVFG